MSRIFLLDDAIEVIANGDNVPLSFFWQATQHPIYSVVNRWRTKKDWWHDPISRDYFLVATNTCVIAVIFCDYINIGWYFQRLYD